MAYTIKLDLNTKFDKIDHIIDSIDRIGRNLTEDKIEIGIDGTGRMDTIRHRLRSIRSLLSGPFTYELIDSDILEELEIHLSDVIKLSTHKKLSEEDIKLIIRMLTYCHRKSMRIRQQQAESRIINSEEFYEKSISNAKSQIRELNTELESLKKNRSADSEKIKETEETIQKLYCDIIEYQKREQEREQRDDAIATWKNKIEESFKTLDKHIKPISNEHKKICNLYWGYLVLSIGIIVLLVVIEIIICCKLYHHDGIPEFKDYLWLIVPLPVAIGLLWGFITQLNRAQRQRVVLSRFIHDIKYTEGVLLAINNLATDVSSSTQRINNALDKLLDKHLSYDIWEGREDYLKKEEGKDTIPYDVLLQVIKSLRGK